MFSANLSILFIRNFKPTQQFFIFLLFTSQIFETKSGKTKYAFCLFLILKDSTFLRFLHHLKFLLTLTRALIGLALSLIIFFAKILFLR